MGRKKAFFRNDKAETEALPYRIASFGESTRFGQRATKSVCFESVDEGRVNGGTDGNGLACACVLNF